MTAASEEIPVVIIGAGPAGLAAAECLQKRNIKHVVLEAGPSVASALRRVDPEMRLLSPTSLSLMPDMNRSANEPDYLSFSDLVKKLERYAEQHRLQIISGATVVSVKRNGGVFRVTYQTSDGGTQAIDASHVINATGIASHPQLPETFHPDQVSFRWLHTLNTRVEDVEQSRNLMVVGGGASAAEVLERWLDVRRPDDKAWLSVRSTLCAFPHWICGIDIHYLVWLPEQLPACLLGWRAGRLHEPMTGLKVKRAIARKLIRLVPGVARYQGDSVWLTDGRRLQPDLVVFATGFRYETKHLGGLLEFDPEGRPRVSNCESTLTPGLYLLGYRFGRTFASPYLRGIARDAEYVAERIAHTRRPSQVARNNVK
ncbi:MAG TPA: FAD-dependent oxidoreductase [Pyrinomonadaceae bacterium]|jgi:cation diffusion facilitator CzcD-associated flavoprotein CzcO